MRILHLQHFFIRLDPQFKALTCLAKSNVIIHTAQEELISNLDKGCAAIPAPTPRAFIQETQER